MFTKTNTIVSTELLNYVKALSGNRIVVALAGPPGAGKSTVSQALVEALNSVMPGSAAVVPGDGFHYDDAVLGSLNLLDRKGSPDTFDVGGFRSLLLRLRANNEPAVAVPVFDRILEISRAAGQLISSDVKYLVVEGNYLLLDLAPWSSLRDCFDATIMLQVDRKTLEARLLDRWRSLGFDESTSYEKVHRNDLPNADIVMSASNIADFTITN
ncbi:nucleoside/nucleotide kinase family protein [Pseudomonas frederiksbergensis]|uniref:nucleoside/nucleotide kinase family protein n=1 Tax=Pseudomonas frederiksbergensis TaxID=104087 RepID=UPI0019801153|nr:nucleoside/nucleotide kinase family protein [Pseudomonas frederiksbergensis]MBN3864301.1 nucleoside/nucleotide kinase family protein [Pseudomonas frederiksbergensis]